MANKNLYSKIEELYKKGALSAEDAVSLIISADKDIESKEETKGDKIEKFIDNLIYGVSKGLEEYEEDNGINIDHCFDIMQEMNWTMYSSEKQAIVPVTKSMIIDTVKDLCRKSINICIEKYEKSKEEGKYVSYIEDCQTTIETGGFRATAYIDEYADNEPFIDVTLEFIPEASYSSIPLKGLGIK